MMFARFAAAFGLASREFDGVDDSVSLTPYTGAGILGSSARSIAFWIKTGASNSLVFAYGDSSGSGTRWRAEVSDGSFGRPTGGLTLEINGGFVTSNTVITSGSWVHVVVTFAGGIGIHSGTTFYINGSAGSKTDGGADVTPNTASSAAFQIGKDLGASGYIDANIADFRIYSSELTSGDVTTIYGGGDLAANLIGRFFGNSDDVLDYSGQGNNGTNSGSIFSTDGPFD